MVAAVSTAATGFAIVGDAAANRRLAAAPPCVLFFAPLRLRPGGAAAVQRRKRDVAVCFVVGAPRGKKATGQPEEVPEAVDKVRVRVRVTDRAVKKQLERRTYLVAAVMSSLGITSMAVMAVYYRFAWQMEGGDVPVVEMFGTFALSVGAAVGMEFWARWAHRALWHASLWHMHESHHRPREGPFELNDVFAIINAGPAIALLAYGFFNRGFFPGLCFGAYPEKFRKYGLHALTTTILA